MSNFWIISILLIVIALVFLILPFCKRTRSLRDYFLLVVLVLSFPFCTLLIYFNLGSYSKLSQVYFNNAKAKEVKLALQKFDSRQKIIDALQQKLNHLPQTKQTARGWYLLGKLYVANQQSQQALDALTKAYTLDSENPEIAYTLVATKFFLTKQLDNSSKELLIKLTQSREYKVDALNLLATSAYQQKAYDQAINYWEQVLQFLPPEGEDSKAVLTIVANAQRLRSQPEIKHTEIRITINVKDDCKDQFRQGDTLFVYALNNAGPRIPLAVKKLVAEKFPVAVNLNEKDAMLADHTLSGASIVQIEARISKSGNAVAQSGDLLGRASLNLRQKSHVTVIIKDRVP